MISVKDIIQQSWKVYETNFIIILKIIIWGFLAMAFSTIGSYLIEFYFNGDYLIKTALNIIATLPQILVSFWVTIALIDLINKLLEKKKAVLSESINKGFQIFLPILLLGIIVALIQIAGFILLIIPGIIFTVWFAFGAYEVILNNKKIKEALKASKELSKDRWFPVAWCYLAPSFFWTLAGWVATSILIFATNQVIIFTKTTLDITGAKILTLLLSICQNAFFIFFIPLMIASVIILYRDLKKT